MDLTRPGRLYPDGVFVFDEPVKVECRNGEITYAHGYTRECPCGPCVYIDPYCGDDRGYAIKSWALTEKL